MHSFFPMVLLVIVCILAVMSLMGFAMAVENACMECEDDSEEDEAASLSAKGGSLDSKASDMGSHPRIRRAREQSPVARYVE